MRTVVVVCSLLAFSAWTLSGCITTGHQIVMGPSFKDLEQSSAETATIKRKQCGLVIFPLGGGVVSGQEGLFVLGNASADTAMKDLVQAWRSGAEKVPKKIDADDVGDPDDDDDIDDIDDIDKDDPKKYGRRENKGSTIRAKPLAVKKNAPTISPKDGWKLAYITLEKRVENYLNLGRVCRVVVGTFVRVPVATKAQPRPARKQPAPALPARPGRPIMPRTTAPPRPKRPVTPRTMPNSSQKSPAGS